MEITNNKAVIGKNIFPDLSKEILEDIKKFEEKYNIKIEFLFDDGISIEYSNDYREINENSQGYSLITCSGDIAFIIIESFERIEFTDLFGKKLLEIPIIEGGFCNDL